MLAAPAQAAFPGANGKIADSEYEAATDPPASDVYTMNPDGTNFVNLTHLGSAGAPAWSPDSAKLVFDTNRDGNHEIYSMDADGTGQTRLTNNPAADGFPAWSPDGTKIAFSTNRDGNSEIYWMNADGTGQTRLTNNPAADGFPAWSPDGTKIAFSTNRDGNTEIYSMNPDGTGATNLTNDPGYQFSPSWSPDGSQIAYAEGPYEGGQLAQINVMDRDGSGQTQITGDGSYYDSPGWSPDGTKIAVWRLDADTTDVSISTMNPDGTGVVSVHAPGDSDSFGSRIDWGPVVRGYPRPKGATPFKTFLVVAYKPCTTPNRTHGAPLAFPSCTPPQQASDFLTVGTGDANGEDANSVDSVRYDVHPGNPATPADEADVGIGVAMRDIRRKSDLSDYTGEVQVTTDLRITDRDNTPSPGGPGAGTVEDAPLSATVQCVNTADTTTGAVCNLTTSADALYPGAVKEGRRSVWQLGQVRAYDGGADGVVSTSAGNTLFMDEGVFVP